MNLNVFFDKGEKAHFKHSCGRIQYIFIYMLQGNVDLDTFKVKLTRLEHDLKVNSGKTIPPLWVFFSECLPVSSTRLEIII